MNRILGEKADQIPILDIEKRCGATDYIDFIRKKEVKYPIMKGVDCYRRPFIVMKVISDKDKSQYMETFFQRYTDDSHLWMGAGWGGMFMETCGGMREEHFEFLKKLADGQICDLPEEILSCGDSQREQLRLCTQEEVNGNF